MMRLAIESMKGGGVAPAVFNAANEVAVEAFLGERIPFLAIPAIVSKALGRMDNFEPGSLADILAADQEARRGAAADVKDFK
jgi:1-deoxy-D-xylulose-5-phosphate reductoisomerase